MRFLGQKRRKKITAKTKAIKSVASPFGLRSWPFDAAQGRAVGRFAADLDAGLKSLCEKSKFMGRAFSPCDARHSIHGASPHAGMARAVGALGFASFSHKL